MFRLKTLKKNAIPKAAAITEGFNASKRKPPINQSIPCLAPDNVTDRKIKIIRITNSEGTIHLLVLSIPFRKPFTRTIPQVNITKAVIES